MTTHLEQFQTEKFVQAGLAKLGQLPPNFMIYCAGWLGDMTTRACVMELTGAVFREAKRGPRKGQLCIEVPGTRRKAYLSCDEMDALK